MSRQDLWAKLFLPEGPGPFPVGSTRIRAIIGDRNDCCSPMQAQAHIHAIRVAGGDATLRIVPGGPMAVRDGPAHRVLAEGTGLNSRESNSEQMNVTSSDQ